MKLILLLVLIGSISCGFRDIASKIYIGVGVTLDLVENDANYRSIAAEQFNCLTAGNEMKIDATEPSLGKFDYTAGDKLVAFAEQSDMKMRGHTLVWHAQVPDWTNELNGSSLITAMKNHISNLTTHWKGSIYAWDVANEVLNEDGTLRDTVWLAASSDYLKTAFQTAHEADPSAKLYINDYNIEGINDKSTGLYNLVNQLLQQGVPIHGVGFQSHLTVGYIPSDMQQNMQRFADLGLDVAITELDMRLGGHDEAAQALGYSTVIKNCKAITQCVGVTIWGIYDDSSDPHLPWDSNHNSKAAVIAAIESALV